MGNRSDHAVKSILKHTNKQPTVVVTKLFKISHLAFVHSASSGYCSKVYSNNFGGIRQRYQ